MSSMPLARLLPLALAVAVGCGGKPVTSKPLDSVKPTPARSGPTTLSGTLVGHDGKPMVEAHVHVDGSSTKVAEDGTFHMEVDEPFVRATFTGVDHAELSLGITTADGSVELDVQLGTYVRPDKIDELVLATYKIPLPAGEIPRATGQTVMFKKSDTLFTARIPTEDAAIGYHVMGIAVNRNINGPDSDSFAYDNGGDYISVKKAVDGVVTIEVDLEKLVPSGAAKKVAFRKPESTAARVARAFADSDYSGYADEKNEWVRTAKLLAFLTSKDTATKPEVTADVLERVVAEVPVDSPLWQMAPGALFALSMSSDEGLDYVEKVAAALDDPNQAAQILFSLLFTADRNGNVETMKRLRDKLKSEYADTPYAQQADRFDPDRKIMAGKALPAFDYEVWGGASHITPKSLEGKEVVIKFWATWCKPCIAEMDELHKLWDDKKDSDFAMVSININDSAEAMEKFRKDKWPMPWTNVYLDAGQSAEAMKMWEIVGIPKTVKADKQGVIKEVTVGGSI